MKIETESDLRNIDGRDPGRVSDKDNGKKSTNLLELLTHPLSLILIAALLRKK